MRFDLTYNFRNEVKWYSSDTIENSNQTFPDVRLSITSIERIPYMNKIITSSGLSSNYSRKMDATGAHNKVPTYSQLFPLGFKGIKSVEPPNKEGITKFSVSDSYQPLISWTAHWRWKIYCTGIVKS